MENASAIRSELEKLMKIHGIRNASFCCTDDAGRFHGLMSIQETQAAAGLFESALNVGRLWQHTRSTIKDILNDFEKE